MNIASGALSSDAAQTASQPLPAHIDVLIVGAGISGIDAARHLRLQRPGTGFLLLETQDGFGGTWRTHRYPGARSDSDLHTFGFGWKPWRGPSIATAGEILDYLQETIDEQEIADAIRYGHKLEAAAWDSQAALWRLSIRRLADDAALEMTCGFLWMCQGYYRHDEGYTPDWPGLSDFKGEVVHPQTWPEDLDVSGKKVVVIGSGATAATLIPALAGKAAHVTMLQRSPTWFYPRPSKDEFTDTLRSLNLPWEWFHEIMRRKVLVDGAKTVQRSFEEPDALGQELLGAAQAYLGPDAELAPHFTPSYRPWRQRLAVVPDGDLFLAIRRGEASVVTDRIARFAETGIELESGETLEADIVVTATGFHMSALGDVAFEVDGQPWRAGESWTWRGIMFSGLPNLAWTFGYLRTSWTMRADLVSDFVCRLLGEMEAKGARQVVPELREEDRQMEPRSFVDPENFNAGYILRGEAVMPRQGDREPWTNCQDYEREKVEIPAADLDDGTLRFA